MVGMCGKHRRMCFLFRSCWVDLVPTCEWDHFEHIHCRQVVVVTEVRVWAQARARAQFEWVLGSARGDL